MGFYLKLFHMCITSSLFLTLCMVAIGAGIGCCCGCHQKQKWDHCDCGKTKWRRILNLVPDTSAESEDSCEHGCGIMSPFRGKNTNAIDRSEAFFFIHDRCARECAHRCKVHGDTMEQHTHILVIHYSCHKAHGVIPHVSTWGHNTAIFETQRLHASSQTHWEKNCKDDIEAKETSISTFLILTAIKM